MKILHVADLHLQHDWFDWVATHCVEYDLLVIAGDLQNAFSNVSMHEQARAITRWMLSLTAPTVVASGNHDFWAGDPRVSKDVYAEAGWLKLLRARPVRRAISDQRNFSRSPGCIIGVDADTVEIRGVRIAVNGWLPVPNLSEQVDMLVTHAPPVGCSCAAGAEGRDVGDPELWPAIVDTPPRWILAGHIHAPNRLWCRWPVIDPTTLILVPGCDETAKVPAHWVVDTDAMTATHSCGEKMGFKL